MLRPSLINLDEASKQTYAIHPAPEKMKLKEQKLFPPLALCLCPGKDLAPPPYINVDWEPIVPPPGIHLLRADIRELEHYVKRGCVVDIVLKRTIEKFNQPQVLLKALIVLLKPGGEIAIKSRALVSEAILMITALDLEKREIWVMGNEVVIRAKKQESPPKIPELGKVTTNGDNLQKD